MGSFLNVVILRYNTGKPIVNGRSECFSCGKKLGFHEMVPVFSFIFLRGRCSRCKSKISWQYPLVEFLTGLVFWAIFYKSGFPANFSVFNLFSLLFYLLTWSILIVIFVYDMRHKIIPDGLVYAFAVLSLIYLLVFQIYFGYGAREIIYSVLVGFEFFLPFFLLWFFSGGRWMGFGDAKLALGIGWFLGLWNGLAALVLAFWIGAAYSIAVLLLNKLGIVRLFFLLKNLTMKSEIPFAPFLILGVATAFFAGIDFWSIAIALSSL